MTAKLLEGQEEGFMGILTAIEVFDPEAVIKISKDGTFNCNFMDAANILGFDATSEIKFFKTKEDIECHISVSKVLRVLKKLGKSEVEIEKEKITIKQGDSEIIIPNIEDIDVKPFKPIKAEFTISYLVDVKDLRNKADILKEFGSKVGMVVDKKICLTTWENPLNKASLVLETITNTEEKKPIKSGLNLEYLENIIKILPKDCKIDFIETDREGAPIRFSFTNNDINYTIYLAPLVEI